MRVYFYLNRALIKRYSIGVALERLGAVMQLESGNIIPALKKMFFNCIRFQNMEGESWTFRGSSCGFIHSDFVKLFNFAEENTTELQKMLETGATGGKIMNG